MQCSLQKKKISYVIYVDGTSVPIGAWKCKLPAVLRNYERPNDQPTNQPTDMKSHREVKVGSSLLFYGYKRDHEGSQFMI